MMSISTRGRFASRIMVFLATVKGDRRVSKVEIAQAEGLSSDYVQQLLMMLKTAGLVKSHRGKTGGFSLAASAETITIGAVLRAVEGPVAPAPCSVGGDCERASICPTRGVWSEAARLLDDLFERTTLADLARQEKGQAASMPTDPAPIPAEAG